MRVLKIPVNEYSDCNMKKQLPIYDQVRALLVRYERRHLEISRQTGVPQSSISRLHRGQSMPTLATVQPLLDWFAAQDVVDKPRKAPAKRLRAGRITTAKPIRVGRRAGVGATASL